MSASASATWRSLVATHVRGYRRDLDELTNALTAVVQAPAESATSHDQAAASLQASLRLLLTRAVEVDDAVQRSFRARAVAPSENEASASASMTVKTASFWQTLAETRRLAAALDQP
jgi:hypothetical protein